MLGNDYSQFSIILIMDGVITFIILKKQNKATLPFLAGVGHAVLVPVMYGGRGKGPQPPGHHVFGADGFQSASSILKCRDPGGEEKKQTDDPYVIYIWFDDAF